MAAPMDPAVEQALVENHRRFLAFLERRVGSRAAAEDILQEAFVRGMGAAHALRDRESAVAWFYRLLRNALTDHYRRRAAETRALTRFAAEPRLREVSPAELTDAVCRCVDGLLRTLKPAYAEALRQVDMEGARPADYARAAGISANNASVRLHRARLALKKQVEKSCGTCAAHGCYACECRHAHPGEGDAARG